MPIIAFYPLAMNESKKTTSKEGNSEANNKNNSASEEGDKLITPERNISQTRDTTSGVNNKNKEDKKSKTCSIL